MRPQNYSKWIKLKLKNASNKLHGHILQLNYSESIEPSISEKQIQEYNKKRPSGPHKLICKAPFNSLYFDPFGNVTSCCFNRTFHLGNVSSNTIKEIWQGEKSDLLRESIKNYNFSKGCGECLFQLSSGDFSHFGGQHYDNSSVHDDYPTRLSFELSNICNLECIMCSGRFSNLIRKNRERLPHIKNAYQKDFVEQIAQIGSKLEFVNFLGGEPTMVKMNLDIMEMLLKQSKNCRLHVTTNATQIGDKYKELLASGRFEISISLDSIKKESYEKIRQNAVWETTLENINFYLAKHKLNEIKLMFTACPMINNWKEIPDVIEFVDNQNCRIYLNHVIHPPKHSLAYLSSNELKNISNYLSTVELSSDGDEHQHNKEVLSGFKSRIDGYLILSEKRETFFLKMKENETEALIEAIKNQLTTFFPKNSDSSIAILERLIKVIKDDKESNKRVRCLHYLFDIQQPDMIDLNYPDEQDFINSFEQHFTYGYSFETN